MMRIAHASLSRAMPTDSVAASKTAYRTSAGNSKNFFSSITGGNIGVESFIRLDARRHELRLAAHSKQSKSPVETPRKDNQMRFKAFMNGQSVFISCNSSHVA